MRTALGVKLQAARKSAHMYNESMGINSIDFDVL